MIRNALISTVAAASLLTATTALAGSHGARPAPAHPPAVTHARPAPAPRYGYHQAVPVRPGSWNHAYGSHGWASAHGWGNPYWAHDGRWHGWHQGYWSGGRYVWPRWWHGSWTWANYAPSYVFAPAYGNYGYYWYYCGSADAYYPDVNGCAEGWQLVPANG